jgi:hypothetical protein
LESGSLKILPTIGIERHNSKVALLLATAECLHTSAKKKKHVLNALLLPPNSSAVFELFLSILGKIINEPDSNVFNFEKVINVMQRFN